MAKFPNYEAQGSLPGVSGSVRGNVDVRTGEDYVARAIGGAGGAAFNVGMGMFRAQGEAEYVEKWADATQKIGEMEVELDKTTNTDDYEGIFNRTYSEIEGIEVQNGWAARKYEQAVTELKPKLWTGVQKKKEERIKENHAGAIAYQTALSLTNGNTGPVRALYQTAVSNGWITQDVMDTQMREVDHAAELEQYKNIARTNPDAMLADLKDNTIQGAKYLDADDHLRLRNMAVTFKADRISQEEQYMRHLTAGLWDYAMQPDATAEGVLKAVDALPDRFFDRDAKDKLYKSEMQRFELIRQGAGDPLKVRQDYGVYKDLLYKAQDGQTSEAELREAVNNNKITIADYEHLVKVLNGDSASRSSAYDLSSALKEMDSLIESSSLLGNNEEDEEVSKIMAHRVLEDKINAAKQTGKPMSSDEIKVEMVRVVQGVTKQVKAAKKPLELLETQSQFVSQSVTMIAPDGKRYTVPANQVDEAVRHGWRK